MKRLMPLLSTLGKALNGLVMLSIFGMNALMGYILFAPDDLPKPFYLSYAGGPAATISGEGGEAGGGEAHVAEAASPEPTPDPEVVVVYEPGQGVMVETGTKIVNLADPGGRRYLKTTIVVEVAPPPPSSEESKAKTSSGEGEGGATEDPVMVEFNDEMNKRMPIINDILTTILSSKTFESIYTVEGKEQLRAEILETLNARLPSLQVIAVYFTEFVVQ